MNPDRRNCIVLADVGGTSTRFAVLTDGALSRIVKVSNRDYLEFYDALAGFISKEIADAPIHHALFAVAGLIKDGHCALTNSPWVIDTSEVCARFGFVKSTIVNDFEAVAWALPHLATDDLLKLGGGRPTPKAPMLAIGPGTGFGVAIYVPNEKGNYVLSSEAGHASLPGSSLREDRIIDAMRGRFGRYHLGTRYRGAV